MITKQEFLKSIRTKYPSYAGTDDKELYSAIITKYPEYKTQISDVTEVTPEVGPQPQVTQPQEIEVEDKTTGGMAKRVMPSGKSIETAQKLEYPEGTPKREKYEKRFFSDEQELVNQMVQDGYSEEIARETIVKRRQDYLKDAKLEAGEAQLLIDMADAGLDMPTAVEGLKSFRSDEMKKQWEEMNPVQKAGKTFFDFVVGTLAGGVGKVGGIVDFATRGKSELGKMGMEGREYVREAAPGVATKAGEILGTGAIDYGLGAWLGKTTGLLSKFKKLSTTKQLITGGGGYGGLNVVGELGEEATLEDIVLGIGIGAGAGYGLGKVIVPALGKTVSKVSKYGTAGVKGGAKGLGKSIARDIKRPLTKIKTEGVAPKIAYKTSTRANRFRKGAEEEFKRMTGESTGEFAVKRGMTKTGDDAVYEAVNNWKASKKQADSALNLIDGEYSFKTKSGKDSMKTMIDDLSERLNETLDDNAKKINLLKSKYDKTGKITLTESNEIKRLYSKKFKYPADQVYSKAAQRSKNIQDAVRKKQFEIAKGKGLKNLAGINKTTQSWKFYADNLSSNMAGKEPNRMFGLTDFVALSGGEPTNIALFLGKKIAESGRFKRGLIKGFGKKTKPSIVEAPREGILQSNIQRRASNVSDILSNRAVGSHSKLVKQPQKLLPPGKTTKGTKTFIGPSKKPIKLREKVDFSRPKTQKTQTKGLKKVEAETPKAINTKAGYIDPGAFADDMAKLGKKIVDTKEYDAIAKSIVSKASVAKNKLGEATKIVKEYIKKYGSELKDKLGDLFDELADKVGARTKLLGGKGAKEAPLSNLEIAENMTKSGKSADDVWKKTGWEKGKDGEWKFEIDDAPAVIKKSQIGNAKKVSDVLDHPELYKQYPEIKDIDIEYRNISGLNGYFDPIENKIVINGNLGLKLDTVKGSKEIAQAALDRKTPYWLRGLDRPEGLKDVLSKKAALSKGKTPDWLKDLGDTKGKSLFTSDKQKSTLLHELQHAIQTKEGFAKGTNVEGLIKGELKVYNKILNKIDDKLKTTKDGKQLLTTRKDVKKIINNLEKEGTEKYKITAGEVEARGVQKRLGMTTAEKKGLRPAKTEDIPRSKQTLRRK